MHDIESSRDELAEELLEDSTELEPEGEFAFEDQSESEADLAAELLEVQNDEELDYFFGKILKGASRFLRTPAGKFLKGALRTVAKKALPIAGSALGNMVVPGLGGVIGGKLAGGLGSALGLEAEGLTQDEVDMEVAKRVVRTARQAGAALARNPAAVENPRAAVQSALLGALRRNLPGLVNAAASGVASGLAAGGVSTGGRRSGRWYRRGNRIVLVGA
jgi:hypothetical protein